MKAGDIVFVKGNGLLSKVITYFDEGDFSHVALAVSDTHVLEANWNMRARIREMKYKDYEIVDLGLTDKERDKIVHDGISFIGLYYDYLQIIGYVIKKWFEPNEKNRFNSPKNLICSELIFLIFLGVESKLELALDIHYDITPNQLYEIAKVHSVN